MKLIVGLGNPGKNYDNTRHNTGFMFLDYFLDKKYTNINWKSKFNGLFYENIINDEKVIFLKPQSYMNLSGEVISKYANFYKIDSSDIIVICDDLDLFVGNFKIKDKGSSGGHNGLNNIIKMLGTSDFKRIRIGISNNKDYDTKDYVLSKFSDEEKSKLFDTFDSLIKVLDDCFIYDFSKIMSLYNQKNR